jgi:uncharacterized protein YaeQ
MQSVASLYMYGEQDAETWMQQDKINVCMSHNNASPNAHTDDNQLENLHSGCQAVA